tara:strand:- start:88602 stop:90248 length:1647 start_codon:yes stop_codon:yes gene_type:complete
MLFLFVFLASGVIHSQNEETDQLIDKSYEEIKQFYLNVSEDSIALKEKIAAAYIAKAKKNNDSVNIARGYYYFSTMYGEPELGVAYADTIVQYTKNLQHKNFPATGYFLRGYWHNEVGEYRKALSDYLKGDSIAEQRGNKQQQSYNYRVIAILKDRAGSHSEALVMYKKILDSMETIKYEKNFDNADYLSIIYNTSNVYIKLKKNDSAKIYSRKGRTESIRIEDSSFYYNFVFLEGVIAYFSGREKKAFEGLETSLPHIDDYSKAIAYYYMGEIFKKQGREQNAFRYFKKTDSIAKSIDFSFTELRDAYEHIITYYEEKENFDQQLKYINKTLEIDSALSQSKELKLDLVKKYDTPLLLKKKQKAIDELSRKNKFGNTAIAGLVIVAVVLILLVFYFRLKQKIQKKNFEELLNNTETSKKVVEAKNSVHNIPPEVYKTISLNLEKFEKNNGFVKNLTLAELAKKLDTNTSYLSKVINEKEGKNFSQYLKTLRINYMVERLKTNKKTRSYTIKAIAKEAGFGTAQSFSKAFHQETGIYPSYFIKKLNDN